MKRLFAEMDLKAKFLLLSTALLLLFSLLLSLFYYLHLKKMVMDEALKSSEVILQEVEAIRGYVAEVLRPRMYQLQGRDTFVIEAMSTTYVSLRIMERFSATMEGYIFRRASLNPHNSKNMADSFEEEMFDWFEESTERNFWQGMVERQGKSFFISMIPEYFTAGCIRCHGEAGKAPVELVERYGTDGGFRFQAGDLAGINSVAIPVSASLARINRGTLVIFVITLTTSLLLLYVLSLLFDKLVIERLTTILGGLPETDGWIDGKSGPKQGEKNGARDELDLLGRSVGTYQQYMKTARQRVGLQPNFIGRYVVQAPLVAGSLSWLYSGFDTESRELVSIKLGFDDVLKNPLYSGCLRMELALFERFSHPALLNVIDRVEDVLILEEVRGKSLETLLRAGSLSLKSFQPMMEQLCDLLATLHSDGVVHHDLRPANLILTDQEEAGGVKLIDMGLASWMEAGDAISESGAGPQGDVRYMAPEQLSGKRGDSRSDLYGLGVLLYWLVTGRPPFEDDRPGLKRWPPAERKVVKPRKIVPALSDGIEQVIMKSLAHDPEARYQWVEDFLEDLIRSI